MATRTTTSAGDWTSAIWDGAVPVPGDDVVLNHATTWNASFSVKTIAINAAVTTSGTGRTFTITDSVAQGNVPVTIGAGNTIAGVLATNTPWQISTGYSPTSCLLTLAGTSGSHIAVRDVRFTNGGNNIGGMIVADWVDFLRVGTATHYAFAPRLEGGDKTFRLSDCTFQSCGMIAPAGPGDDTIGYILPGDSFILERGTWTSTAAATAVYNYTTSTRTTGTWRIVGNNFDAYVDLFSPGFTITGNTYHVAWHLDGVEQPPNAGGGGTSYTLSGPASGECSAASANFTATLVGGTATVRVTPSDGGSGGTFTPAYVDLTTGTPSATFTYRPIWWGPKTITTANDSGLTNPAGVAFLAKIALGGTNTVGAICPDLGGAKLAHPDDPYYQPVDTAPIHPNSAALIEQWMADEATPPNPWWRVLTSLFHSTAYGYPYCVVPGDQPLIPIAFTAESGFPQFSESSAPIPANAPIEGIVAGDPIPTGYLSDQHMFIVVRDETTGGPKETWELYSAHKPDGVTWTMTRICWKYASDSMYYDRSDGMPTTSAGGTRIMPALVLYDDVFTRGVINHSLRMMLYVMDGLHIPPARKQASGSPTRPPCGVRFRLKASFDISGFSPGCQVILQALKTYGAIVDDGGPQLEITGTRDARWTPYAFRPELNTIDASNLEVLDWGPGYAMTTPEVLSGLAGVESGEFTVELTPPLENVGEGHPEASPGGFTLNAYRDAVYSPYTGWSGTITGGQFKVNGSNNYRVDLTTSAPSATFTYTPAADEPDGPLTLIWVDNTIQRLVPDAVVYMVGDASTVTTPVFDPAAGTYATEQSVAITSTTLDAVIRYTLDESTPSASVGTIYTGPVTIPAGAITVLKAVASKAAMNTSVVTSGTYAVGVEFWVRDTFTGPAYTLLVAHVGEIGATWTSHPATASGLAPGLELSYGFSLSGVGTLMSLWEWDSLRHLILASGAMEDAEFDVLGEYDGIGTAGEYELGLAFLFHPTTETGWRLNYHKFDPTGSQWELHSVEAGTWTIQGTYADTIGTETRSAKVRVRSGGIAVDIDGVERITSSYTVAGAGDRVGLYRRGLTLMNPSTGIHLTGFSAGPPDFAAGPEPGAGNVLMLARPGGKAILISRPGT